MLDSISLPIKVAKIMEVNKKKKILICSLPNLELGYIPFEDYSIYYSTAEKMPKVNELVSVICQSYDESRKMYRLNSKCIQENYWSTLKNGDIVRAKVSRVANDKMAFCTIGYNIKASITIENTLKIPNSVYSIADLLYKGIEFDAKITSRNRKGYFGLTTYGMEQYENIDLPDKCVIFGMVGTKLNDDSIFKNNKYHYYFHVTFQRIGYISCDFPIGYGKMIYGKLVDTQNFKFILSE